MPVGNSITDGVGSSDGLGFRKMLYNNLSTSGLDFEFVGPHGAPYNGYYYRGAHIEDFHIGHVYDITSKLIQYKPDIVLLHIGTNNLGGTDAPTMANYLRTLIETIDDEPSVDYILVCKIIPKVVNGVEQYRVREYNAKIDEMFFSDNPPSNKMVIVNMYSVVSTSELSSDGIHPNDGGYSDMAGEYATVIKGATSSDSTPPSKIQWKSGYASSLTAFLEWFAPGNNNTSGTANLYELRYSTFQLDNKNFRQGKLVSIGKPKQSGTLQTASITDLLPNQNYFFAIRAWDASNNVGPLSDNIQIITGDTSIAYCENFDDPELMDWSLAPYYFVQDGRLCNNRPQGAWDNLAVYQVASYSTAAPFIETKLVYSDLVDIAGIGTCGAAVLLDNSNYEFANGYMVRVREKSPGNSAIYLEEIIEGETQRGVISEEPFASGVPFPMGGDTLRVRYTYNDITGHTFGIFINENWIGQVEDPQKKHGNVSKLYSGISVYSTYNNCVDGFCVAIPPLDPDSMKIFAESNNQSGEVEKKLALPLSVQVVDVNGQSVGGVQVDFSVTSGEAFLSTDSICTNFNGNIWVESESGLLRRPMITAGHADASGGRYIYVPDNSGNYDNGKAIYSIYIPCDNTYHLWVRYLAPNGNSNSFYFSLGDTAANSRIDLPESSTWRWRKIYTQGLSEGFVDLAFRNREPNTGIDKILLTSSGGFTPDGKGGETQKFSNVTNNAGIASTEVTLGKTSGEIRVEAYAPQVPNGSLQIFIIFANAGTPVSFDYASDKKIIGTAGHLLPAPFAVQLEDKYGNKRRGEMVLFQVVDGDGEFSGNPIGKAFSDEDGIAEAILKLGYEAQTTVHATVSDFPSLGILDFIGEAGEGVPIEIIRLRGDNQTAKVTETLPIPLEVKIVDEDGNPVENYPVPFDIVSGDGLLDGMYKSKVDTTDAEGIASVVFKLGETAGVDIHQVRINVPLINAPMIFKATALADDPYQVIKISGENQQQSAGQTFEQPLVARVVDLYGNGISQYKVKFRVVSGDGNFSGNVGIQTTNADTVVVSDSLGFVQVIYTAGRIAGENQIRIDGDPPLSDFRIFNGIIVLAPTPYKLIKVSGDNPVQTKQVANRLDFPFVIRIEDPFGLAVGPGYRVVFKPEVGGGTFLNQSLYETGTDADGRASATLTLGTKAGTQIAKIYLPDYPNVDAVTFQAFAEPAEAYKIKAITSMKFSGVAGAGPIAIQAGVYDRYDNAKPRHVVKYEVVQGGAIDNSVKTKTVLTDDLTGISQVNYYMGTKTSIQNIIKVSSNRESSTAQLENSPLEFIGTVIPDDPASLVKISGDIPVQSARVMETCQDSFIVEVKDKFGNLSPETELKFVAKGENTSIDGAKEITLLTNQSGRAAVELTLGKKAGEKSDTLLVFVSGYDAIPRVTFYATATAADPHRILAVDDSIWTKQLGQSAIQIQPKVKVADVFGNIIAAHNVEFQIIKGTGTVNGQNKATVPTNLGGIATAIWTLGQKPEEHQLYARSSFKEMPLNGSPVTFRAITQIGEPKYLNLISAKEDTGVAGHIMPSPHITLQVTDIVGNAIYDHPVLFEINDEYGTGNGLFVTQNDSASTLTAKTDQLGFVRVGFIPDLGHNLLKISSKDNENKQLVPSPISILIYGEKARAERIELLTEKYLTAKAGSSVQIGVAAYDAAVAGSLVDGHPIQFKILSGDGFLASSNYIFSSVNTKNGGVALEEWHLGKKVGIRNILEINGGTPVGSPDSVNVTIEPAEPCADSSSISATGQIKADAISYAVVTVTLSDSFGNGFPGKMIRLKSNDAGVLLEQPTASTDSKGKVFGKVRSSKAGSISVSAYLAEDPDFEICCAHIQVSPGDAAQIKIPYGTNQFVGNQGAIIKDSLATQALDQFNNIVPFTQIKYTIVAGGGYFVDSKQKTTYRMTDANGIAGAKLVMGPNDNETYLIEATLNGSENNNAKVTFIGQSRVAPPPYSITKVSGDSSSAPVGATLSEPFVVKIFDKDGVAVWHTYITFEILEGDGSFVGENPALTNEMGQAFIYYKMGSQGGAHLIQAKLTGNSQQVVFVVFGQAGSASKLAPVNNIVQYATVSHELLNAVVVMAQDSHGNPAADIRIKFTLSEQPEQQNGAEILEPSQLTTGPDGLARARIKLGEKTGDYIILATSPDLPGQQVRYRVIANSDVAYYLLEFSGNNQSMTKGRQLVYPIVIKITDQFGNPAPGETVYFVPVNNSGFVSQDAVVTDSLGQAETRWTIGYSESSKLLVSKVGLRPNFIEFTAIGVDNNFPQFIGIPSDTSILYDKPFEFTLVAKDADNDPLTFFIDNLPPNATFNSTTHKLSWTPTSYQKNIWKIKFRVEDNKPGFLKGFDVDSMNVNVTSKIKIYSRYPADVLVIQKPEVIDFSVLIMDQATNQITYNWTVNNQNQNVNDAKFVFNSLNYSNGTYEIKVVVSDGVSKDSTSWIPLVTRVELSSFSGQSLPFVGVILDWETKNEINNLGFDVLRSFSASGPFGKINENIIKSRSDGKYTFSDSTTAPGKSYYYKLEDTNFSGIKNQSDAILVHVEMPKEFRLVQNFPNPFNPETKIRFQIPKNVETKIVIFNINGQVVKTLIDQNLNAGYYELSWDGHNNDDLLVGSGIYYYRFQAGEFSSIKKMVLIR